MLASLLGSSPSPPGVRTRDLAPAHEAMRGRSCEEQDEDG
jgi:hypothetical protein